MKVARFGYHYEVDVYFSAEFLDRFRAKLDSALSEYYVQPD